MRLEAWEVDLDFVREARVLQVPVVAEAGVEEEASARVAPKHAHRPPFAVELEELVARGGVEHDRERAVRQRRGGRGSDARRGGRCPEQEVDRLSRFEVDPGDVPQEPRGDISLLDRGRKRGLPELVALAVRHEDRRDLTEEAEDLDSHVGRPAQRDTLWTVEADLH